MLAFMENALVQSTKAPLEKEAVSTSEPQTQGTMATALLELADIAAQLARVDTMMAQVVDTTPEEEDAKRWHQVSIQALQCSRNMLSEKQSKCLADLGALL